MFDYSKLSNEEHQALCLFLHDKDHVDPKWIISELERIISPFLEPTPILYRGITQIEDQNKHRYSWISFSEIISVAENFAKAYKTGKVLILNPGKMGFSFPRYLKWLEINDDSYDSKTIEMMIDEMEWLVKY